MNNYQDKARGMLVGLAVGDALGAPVEFGYSSQSIINLGDKIAHYQNHRLPKGIYTDDTEMALCLADSLLECGGYDSYDIMQKFSNWANDGYRTYDGKPASDIGNQTMRAIEDFEREPEIFENNTTDSAGNGAIMRLAPIVIANTLEDIEPTLEMAVLSCRETHNSITAEAVTAMFASTLYCALHGLSKSNIRNYCSRWIRDPELGNFYYENSKELIDRTFKKDGTQLKDLGGYIVDAFTIALWGLANFNNFENGMLAVIRLGGDTDTNAACYGQLAGAYYGYEAIPEEWRKGVYHIDELVEIADKLLKMPKCPILKTRFEDFNKKEKK